MDHPMVHWMRDDGLKVLSGPCRCSVLPPPAPHPPQDYFSALSDPTLIPSQDDRGLCFALRPDALLCASLGQREQLAVSCVLFFVFLFLLLLDLFFFLKCIPSVFFFFTSSLFIHLTSSLLIFTSSSVLFPPAQWPLRLIVNHHTHTDLITHQHRNIPPQKRPHRKS